MGERPGRSGHAWLRVVLLLLLLPILVWSVRRAQQTSRARDAQHATPPAAAPRLYGEGGERTGTKSANPDQPVTIPLDVAPLPTPPPPVPALETPPAPPTVAMNPEVAASNPSTPDGAADSANAAPESGDGSTAEFALDLAPRWLVHPNPQSKIVSRRKIDDDVLLKTRVGADGHVQEVVVVHGIPNCDECTASAVEAARRYLYDPPALRGGATGVWTRVEIHFGRHR
jgi:hypothetical protein